MALAGDEVTDMNAPPKLRVAIVYQYVAHYREPIFRELSADEEIEYTIFSDCRSNIPSLAVIDFEKRDETEKQKIRFRKLINVWLFNIILWQRGLLSISLGKHYDSIIFLGDIHYISTWVGAMIARFTGKRVLFWGQGYKSFGKGARSLLKQVFFRLPHGHVLYGNFARDYLIYSGFKKDNLYVVYNSLDFETQTSIYSDLSDKKIDSVRKRLFNNPDCPLLVSVGRIDRNKRLDILVDAVDILRQQGFATNLLIIGDGPDRTRLEQATVGSGCAESIKFLGAIYGEKNLGELIGAADVCVVSGPVGLVIVHAFGYGVPVMAHNKLEVHGPELELLVPDVTGALYEEGDAGSLARAVRQWLERNPNKAAVAGRCRKAVERFYNPAYQHKVINHAVRGLPASDLPSANGAHHWILRKTWPAAALERLKLGTEVSAR